MNMRCIFGAINSDTGKHYQSVIMLADAWNVLQGQFNYFADFTSIKKQS